MRQHVIHAGRIPHAVENDLPREEILLGKVLGPAGQSHVLIGRAVVRAPRSIYSPIFSRPSPYHRIGSASGLALGGCRLAKVLSWRVSSARRPPLCGLLLLSLALVFLGLVAHFISPWLPAHSATTVVYGFGSTGADRVWIVNVGHNRVARTRVSCRLPFRRGSRRYGGDAFS